MAEMSQQDWERFVRQWREAGPELAGIRRNELRSRAYDAEEVELAQAQGVLPPHVE